MWQFQVAPPSALQHFEHVGNAINGIMVNLVGTQLLAFSVDQKVSFEDV